jgi:hypothetical protein
MKIGGQLSKLVNSPQSKVIELVTFSDILVKTPVDEGQRLVLSYLSGQVADFLCLRAQVCPGDLLPGLKIRHHQLKLVDRR